MTRRLMIAGVAVLLAAQSALVLDAAADQVSIEQRSRVVTSSGGRDLSPQPASSTAANASKK
jgi:hypothetical protein